ncbi:MAG: nitroreductase [Chitinivibrionales bacterium]|nr:nitroreductase [Chitinivibrionales bacterium]MBD3357278.1 nitroreductase [Chitinivibrionales bacterium]
MSFLELTRMRRSVRDYRPDPVEAEKLNYILECGRYAPSACNFQPWVFVVVKDEEVRWRLGKGYPKPWFVKAPLVLAVCIDHSRAWVKRNGKSYAAVDAAVAMDHMTLAAAEQGIGTCWIGAFNEQSVREALELPENIEPIVLTPLGYAADEPTEKTRKPQEDVVRWEHF